VADQQKQLDLQPDWDLTIDGVWRCRCCGYADYADYFDVAGAEVGVFCPECGEDTETDSWDGTQWLPPLTPEQIAECDAMIEIERKKLRRRKR